MIGKATLKPEYYQWYKNLNNRESSIPEGATVIVNHETDDEHWHISVPDECLIIHAVPKHLVQFKDDNPVDNH